MLYTGNLKPEDGEHSVLKEFAQREHHSIGNSLEELKKLAKKIGYPIHLIPFGDRELTIRVKNDEELKVKAPDAIEKGFWNLVHVLKPLGKYADEL